MADGDNVPAAEADRHLANAIRIEPLVNLMERIRELASSVARELAGHDRDHDLVDLIRVLGVNKALERDLCALEALGLELAGVRAS